VAVPVSAQQARRDLHAAITALTQTDDWVVTLETDPDIFHKLIVVGHADLIEADAFESYDTRLTITVWVSEADDVDAQDLLYELLSPGPGSLLTKLEQQSGLTGRISVPRTVNVGRRDEGPSGFLAGDIEVSLKLELGLDNEARW
jgi:hypothetical protein